MKTWCVIGSSTRSKKMLSKMKPASTAPAERCRSCLYIQAKSVVMWGYTSLLELISPRISHHDSSRLADSAQSPLADSRAPRLRRLFHPCLFSRGEFQKMVWAAGRENFIKKNIRHVDGCSLG